MERNILEVKRLKVSFRTNNGTVKAVRDISFNLKKGKTLAIVGESGSGKSVTSKVILGISAPNAIIEGGEVLFDNKDIVKLSEEEMYDIRGDKISMIFQDPLSSLNPIVKIGTQITEAMLLKNKEKRKRSRKLFNTHLRVLEENIVAAYKEKGEDIEAKAKAKCKEFDAFNIVGLNLENEFNESLRKSDDLIADVKEFLFLAEHKRKQNVPALLKRFANTLNEINNPYFVRKDDVNKKAEFSNKLLELSKTVKYVPSEKQTIVPEEITKCCQELLEFLNKLVAHDRPNFFRYGYYLLHHADEKLEELPSKEAAEKTLKFLDENFMLDFIDMASQGILYSHKQALEGKKHAIEYLTSLEEFFSNSEFDKKQAHELTKKAKEEVDPSIDKLSIYADTVANTFADALNDFVKKYNKAEKDNIKDLKRFNRQTARREALVAKGKKIDWQVVPYKDIDLDDIRGDIISIITRLKNNYQEFINNAGSFDANKTCIALIDQFKDQASSVVYKLSKKEAKERALKLMEEVGIPEPRLRFKQYPFEFSGGMRQRIVIAIALTADPDILICDEPTTALDVTIQAQILELINKIKAERQLSVIFITHDLGVVANMADEIAVMYAGKIVEYGTAEDIFYNPRHPYTWALLSSMPDLDTKDKLEAIPGTPPNMIYPPKGDAFAARNKYAMQIDFERQPPLFKVSDTHYAATWLLHPDAPKVEIPQIIKDRIARMREKETKDGK